MAVGFKPSPMGELAKLLGQSIGGAARIGVGESTARQMGGIYQQENPDLTQQQALALARNPQAAKGYFAVKAAR